MNNFKKIILTVLCVESLILIGFIINGSFQPATVLVGVLSNLTNQERQLNNLGELKVNPLLSVAAQLKAEDMAKNEYFSHTSPDGKTPWYWLDLIGYKYDYAGENLAINFNESEEVTNAWMNSPSHRENLLKKSYTEMGTGIATGTYKGKAGIFIVQDYASPREKIANYPTSKDNFSEKNISDNSLKASATNTQVLGAMTKFVENISVQKILIVIILASLAMIAVILLIFLIKFIIRQVEKHPVLLNILLIALVITLGAYFFYQLMLKEETFITSSTNYSSENTAVTQE